MAKNNKTTTNKAGPKTRAQLKKQEERKKAGIQGHRIHTENERSTSGEDTKKKGWTSLQDAEAKLKALERQYNNAKDDRTKKKIQELVEKYEKQAKALLIENATKVKEHDKENTNTRNNTLQIINQENEDKSEEEEETIMSDITTKTANSVNKFASNTPERKRDKSLKSNNKNSLDSNMTENQNTEITAMKGKISNRTPREINSASAKEDKDNGKIAQLEVIGRTRKSPRKTTNKMASKINSRNKKKKLRKELLRKKKIMEK